MKKKKLTVITVSAAAVLVAGVCLWVGLRYLTDNRMPNFSKEYVLYVYPDMSAETALDSIAAGAGVIRPGSMDRCAGKEDLGGRICPGRYEIDPSMTSIYVVRMLCNGWQSPQKLTLSGTIRSKGKLASVIDRQMMVDSVTVDSLLNSNEFLQQFGFDSTNVFALFLPDTYYMYWTATPDEIFSRFRKEYDAFCRLLENGSILLVLYREQMPCEETAYGNTDWEAWKQLCAEHVTYCLRMDWENEENNEMETDKRMGFPFHNYCVTTAENKYRMEELIIHPRVQKDFYKNTPNMKLFTEALAKSSNPVCYNGDIFTVEDYIRFIQIHPEVECVMTGRGVLADPALARKIRGGAGADAGELRRFHDLLYAGYCREMSGDRTILFKMKELWTYLAPVFTNYKKYVKKIKKAEKCAVYEKIIEELFANEEISVS